MAADRHGAGAAAESLRADPQRERDWVWCGLL